MVNEKLNALIKLAQGDRSQNQFALHCGVNSSTITQVLHGRHNPSPEFLKKIADRAYNGVTFEMLLEASFSAFSDEPFSLRPNGVVESPDLSLDERELIDAFRLMRPAQQALLLKTAQMWSTTSFGFEEQPYRKNDS